MTFPWKWHFRHVGSLGSLTGQLSLRRREGGSCFSAEGILMRWTDSCTSIYGLSNDEPRNPGLTPALPFHFVPVIQLLNLGKSGACNLLGEPGE